MPNRYLGVDGGRTATRIALFEAGRQMAAASGPGLPYRVEGSAEPMLAALSETFEGLNPRPSAVTAVCLGLASVENGQVARLIADRVSELVRATRIRVTVDAVTAHAGALGLRPGVVVAAGTGVIALAVRADGAFARSDGWGYILGDDGSGYAIGRAGLTRALRTLDGRGTFEALRRQAERAFGPLEQLAHRIYAADNPVQVVAGFAPYVAEAARQGDLTALALWEEAACEIAATAVAAARRLFEPGQVLSVTWAGGLFQCADLLLASFQREVRRRWPGAQLLPPIGTPLDGALLLACAEGPTPLDELIHTFTTET